MRTAFVHVGTHKTGTKALQVFCAMNRATFAGAGIHYPQAGRVELGTGSATPGHHQIAFDLMRSRESPSLDATLAEIDAIRAPNVLLSSEEFHMLLGVDGALERLVGELRSRQYRAVAILYVRMQPYYAESLYAEFVKGGLLTDLPTYFDAILEGGEFRSGSSRSTLFEYSRLIERLAGVFAPSDLVVRPYDSRRAPEALLADFLNVIAHVRGVPISANFNNPMPHANESLTFRALLERISQLAGADADVETFLKRNYPNVPGALLDARFSLLTRGDVERFLERFDEDNRRVAAMCGVRLSGSIDLPDAGDPRFERAKTHREMLAAILDDAKN